jgi:pimeloyl-ACP methyl ester carboxylesterase
VEHHAHINGWRPARRKRVAMMVLVSATPHFPPNTREIMRVAAAAEHSDEDWALMRARHPQGDLQIRALWAMPERFANDHDDHHFTPDALRGISAARLIVGGDRDPLYPVELALEIARAIPRAALWVVPNGGHSPVFATRGRNSSGSRASFFATPRSPRHEARARLDTRRSHDGPRRDIHAIVLPTA